MHPWEVAAPAKGRDRDGWATIAMCEDRWCQLEEQEVDGKRTSEKKINACVVFSFLIIIK